MACVARAFAAAVVILALPRPATRDVRAADAAPAAATPEAVEFFEKRVRPVLVGKCLECHGDKAKGGLRLDSRSGMLTGGDSGAVIAPGDPDGSLLLQAVRYGEELKMPPEGKLDEASISALADWVRMGAPWPAESVAPASAGTGGRTWKAHWAFQPVRAPDLPPVRMTEWPRASLDYFVLAELERASLTPSNGADRRTLLRRATFDVTGLPPTPQDVDRFVADDSPDAFDRVVARLLASQAYGERWARHWLDVARYADTKGYVFTQDRSYPNAYRYRDWVVTALNDDLPYDRFLIQQIAADRLPASESPQPAAMGFLTVGRRFLNNPHDIIDDRIDVLTRGTMALTVTCARCHDHKYDPIPTRDYYSLYGVMASSVEPEQPAGLMTLADAPRPVVPHVFVRGNPGNRGEAVPRQFLSALAGDSRQPFTGGSGRLDLARAIASRDNPLTARVIVNRVWMHYFDNPLVRTPSDFGLRSDPPTHPELLDHLASYLVEHGWSLKALHRLILKSATYAQASLDREDCRRVDPENRLLWRMNRKRLDFEAMRDSLLAVAGELDPSVGGPAVELTKAPFPRRRTLYGLVDRQNLPNLFRTFDFASPDTHSPQRFSTTVPQQALFMMNSPFLAEQARRLASRAELCASDDPRQRVTGLYRFVFGREPSDSELQLALAFLTREAEGAANSGATSRAADEQPAQLTSWQRYVQAVLVSNEFVFVD
jgi:hypothetical protein